MRLDSQRVTTPGFVVSLAVPGIVAGGKILAPARHVEAAGELTGTDGTVVDHIGWHTTEYDPWLERLRANGVSFVEEPRVLDAGHRIAFIEGPDGAKIELAELLGGATP
ncbi:MAG: VOC family protein [Acidobacteriota bacterium]|nr:VOC family protein [Acidobacteriota bacterium]